jgi:hypothetical protein
LFGCSFLKLYSRHVKESASTVYCEFLASSGHFSRGKGRHDCLGRDRLRIVGSYDYN